MQRHTDGRKVLPSKSKPETLQRQPKTARQDALERKTVFRQVLDNPLAVPWPAVSQTARSLILDALLELLGGISLYRRNLEATRSKPLKEGPVQDKWWNEPFVRDPKRPAVLDHLVIGINAVTKALEEPDLAVVVEEEDGRAKKRRKKMEALQDQVAKDVKRAPTLAETIRTTGVQPALPPAEGMQIDNTTVVRPRSPHSIAKRRRKRRQACREVFLAKKRVDTLEAMKARQVEKESKAAEEDAVPADDHKEAGRIEFVIVCRPDIDPPTLVSHMPQLVAAYNARSTRRVAILSTTYLVQLNAGAEAVLCRALHLRRAAMIGIRVRSSFLGLSATSFQVAQSDCPDLSKLTELITATTLPPIAEWMTRSDFQPTAIRHLPSHGPIDPKAARQARKADMKETRQVKSKRVLQVPTQQS